MNALIDALKGTPWWVYLLFVYLLYAGIQGLKSRIASLKKILILPFVLFVWSLYGLIAKFHGIVEIFIWAAFTCIGYGIGMTLFKRLRIKADKKKLWVRISGSRAVLILLMTMFFLKYFFGYYYATHPALSVKMHIADLIISGTISGIFIGRMVGILKKFAKAKHEKLRKDGNPPKEYHP